MKTREAAGLILYDKDKKVLLQHRSEDALRSPGFWGMFGGGIEAGETPEEAVRRELLEELEYRPINPNFLFFKERDEGDVHLKIYTFIEKYDESQKLVQHEGQGMGWFKIEDALKLKLSETRREALIEIGEYLKKL